jgi:hypothetical protein
MPFEKNIPPWKVDRDPHFILIFQHSIVPIGAKPLKFGLWVTIPIAKYVYSSLAFL